MQRAAFPKWLSLGLAAVWSLVGLGLLAGCSEATPTPLPVTVAAETASAPAARLAAASVTATVTAAVTATATQQATQVAPLPGAAPAVDAATITATVTVTGAAVLPLLTVSETLNVRSGPGINYPIVASLAAGAMATVNGRSSDSQWWRIVCPPEVTSGQCWVIGDPLYSTLTDAVSGEPMEAVAAIAVATAAPAPTPSPSPAPTPCVAAAPSGWRSYSVRSGDTLSALSARSGAGVDAIRTANCLESDLIIEGDTLYLPGGLAAAPVGAPVAAPVGEPVAAPVGEPGGGVAAASGAASDDAPVVVAPGLPDTGPGVAQSFESSLVGVNLNSLNEGLANSLRFSEPDFSATCAPNIDQDEPSITIGTGGDNRTHGTTWVRGQFFGICWNSSGESEAVTFIVSSPRQTLGRFPTQLDFALGWTVDITDPPGVYTVTTKEYPNETATFTLTAGVPITPTVAVFRRSSGLPVFSKEQDSSISFVVSGYRPGPVPMFLCRLDEDPKRVCFPMSGVEANAAWMGHWSFATKDLEPGTYMLHDGSPLTKEIDRDHPSIFILK